MTKLLLDFTEYRFVLTGKARLGIVPYQDHLYSLLHTKELKISFQLAISIYSVTYIFS